MRQVQFWCVVLLSLLLLPSMSCTNSPIAMSAGHVRIKVVMNGTSSTFQLGWSGAWVSDPPGLGPGATLLGNKLTTGAFTAPGAAPLAAIQEAPPDPTDLRPGSWTFTLTITQDGKILPNLSCNQTIFAAKTVEPTFTQGATPACTADMGGM